jgi:hypothetical protein
MLGFQQLPCGEADMVIGFHGTPTHGGGGDKNRDGELWGGGTSMVELSSLVTCGSLTSEGGTQWRREEAKQLQAPSGGGVSAAWWSSTSGCRGCSDFDDQRGRKATVQRQGDAGSSFPRHASAREATCVVCGEEREYDSLGAHERGRG